MRRTLHFVAPTLVILLAWTLAAEAAPPRSQEGLPPELTIAAQPPLAEQLQTLQGLTTYAQQNGSRSGGGGVLEGLKNMFSTGGSKSKAAPIQPAILQLNASQLKGKSVAVSGIYKAKDAENGLLAYDGGALLISLPAGIQTEGFDQKGPSGLPVTIEGVVESAASGAVQVRATAVRPDGVLTLLRVARVQELLNQPESAQETYFQAFKRAQAAQSPFAAYATTALARLAYDKRDVKVAKKQLSMAWNPFTGVTKAGQPLFYTWVPNENGSGWQKVGVKEAIKGPLDTLNRSGIWYRFMDFFVLLAGGNRWLGIILLAIISRVVIWPLTKKQLDSAEAMKRLQPQIKALQDKYVDDKNQFQTEFWKLCQANGVNPLGGCLPMLAQMPVLIMLWNGIRDYIVQFDGHSFLWAKNLAAPDTGLLVAYTISMVFFQKMTQKLQPSPTMTPQQAQQQQMMTYMMPLMFFFFFKTFPAAFLLYWLATNLVYFVQQYYYTVTVARKYGTGTETLVPDSGKQTGFAGAMAKMMSMKTETPEEDKPAEPKSFHEQQAENRGKKTGKTGEPSPKRKH